MQVTPITHQIQTVQRTQVIQATQVTQVIQVTQEMQVTQVRHVTQAIPVIQVTCQMQATQATRQILLRIHRILPDSDYDRLEPLVMFMGSRCTNCLVQRLFCFFTAGERYY